ncbi:MAG: substrate-binding periplasmic protein [Kordiimonas sp.]
MAIYKVKSGISRITAKLFILLLFAVLVCPKASAGALSEQYPSEVIKIIGAHLEGRLDEDPTSGYRVLIRKILPTDTHYFQFARYPLTRALRDFKETERACIFPSSAPAVRILTGDQNTEFVESEPVDIVTSHIISAPHRPTFATVRDLDGHSVAVQQSVVTSRFLRENSTATITRTPNDLTALKMLLAGRVDAMYGWFPDIFIIAEKNGLSLPHFNPDLILFKTTTHLVCKEFVGNELLFKIVNTRIKDLKRKDELQKILGVHARILEY